MHLLDAIFAHKTQKRPSWLAQDEMAYEILRKLCSVMQHGFSLGAVQRRPHLVLLDKEVFYRVEVMPLLAEWMSLYLMAQVKRPNLRQHIFVKQLMGSSLTAEEDEMMQNG